ncbi:MAG: N-acetylmuramic acid 6-phosphate etherase [Gemmatimonadales bacterium]
MTESFHDARLTERRNPRTQHLDTLTPVELVDALNAEDAAVAAAVARARAEIGRTIELAERAFRDGGRLIYVGAGTSGRLGVLDAVECPPTFGTPPEMVVGVIAGGASALLRSVEGAEDDEGAALAAMDSHRVGPADLVIGIAASATTPYVRAALVRAKALGAATAFLSCSEPPDILRETCDACITVLVGPEAVTGSTRMKAGTATKLVLNTITTGAMVRLGKVYGNLMVDLQAMNAKLVDRSERIVMETTGAGRVEARAAIDAAGGRVKRAIVMLRRRVGPDEADRLLEEHRGFLRPVVGDPPPIRGGG